MHQQGTPWPDALPAVLCSIQATHNKETGLSPFEVITGRPMSLPGTIDLRNADIHLTSDAGVGNEGHICSWFSCQLLGLIT